MPTRGHAQSALGTPDLHRSYLLKSHDPTLLGSLCLVLHPRLRLNSALKLRPCPSRQSMCESRAKSWLGSVGNSPLGLIWCRLHVGSCASIISCTLIRLCAVAPVLSLACHHGTQRRNTLNERLCLRYISDVSWLSLTRSAQACEMTCFLLQMPDTG